MALSKLNHKSFVDTVEGNPSLIINGDMAISQRGTSFTTPTAYTIDRIFVSHTATDQLVTTVSQSSTAPSGFSNSLRINVTTAETALAADEVVYFETSVEAQNLQHLNYGASSAKSLTASFWVRSSLTGKYSVLFYQHDATRSNLQSFNINTADTWEYKTITIDGDTGGTINDDNGKGLSLYFTLAAGTNYTGTPHTGWGAYVQTDDFAFSDNVDFSAQTGNFYITGIKLEVGSEATPFLHENYAENLNKCRRYYYRRSSGGTNDGFLQGGSEGGSTFVGLYTFPVSMRASPSYSSANGTNYFFVYNGSSVQFNTLSGFVIQSTESCLLYENTFGSSLTSSSPYNCRFQNASAYIDFDAEL